MKKIRPEFILLFLILIIAVIFRFWHLSQLQYFNIDEELEAFFSQRIFLEKRPVLTGEDFPGGIQTGPFFRYFASTMYALSGFDPIGVGVAASALGVVSVGLIFWVGKLFAGKKVGLLAAFFYSLSYLIVIYNRFLSPISWAPVVTLMSYISLYKIAVEKKIRYMLLLGVAFAMGLNSDPSTFSLMLLALMILIPIKQIRSRRVFLPFFTIILMAIIPVVLFDFRHGFPNTKKVISLFSNQRTIVSGSPRPNTNINSALSVVPMLGRTFSRIFYISGPWDVVKQILPCESLLKERNAILPFIFWGSFFILGYFFYRTIKEKKFGLCLISGHLLIIIGGIVLYNLKQPGYTHEWFLSVFFPSFCLILAYISYWAFKKPILRFPASLLIINFALLQAIALFHGINSAGMALKKKAVVYAISEVGNEPFYLDVLSSCYAYGGNRYLFRFFKKDPAVSYMDYVYAGWFYPRYNGPSPKRGVVIMHFTEPVEAKAVETYELYKKRAIKKARFEDIEVLIVGDRQSKDEPPYF
ncbi:MAG: glycosyltransferase family 39 protein [Actinobacteria bacterium]|nr:glycosyltransferase family 39 protein [Actinomycetota bacterium]